MFKHLKYCLIARFNIKGFNYKGITQILLLILFPKMGINSQLRGIISTTLQEN